MRSTSAKVLLIDDDEEIGQLISQWLIRKGYETVRAKNGPEGLRSFHKERPDIVLLDVMLPEMDGWDICRRIREMSEVPIVFLSAKAETSDKIHGLDLGADDYVTKPFEFSELVARIDAALRRADGSKDLGPSVFEDGGMIVDFANFEVFLDGHRVDLSPTEFKVLGCLIRNAGRVVTHDQLLSSVWGSDYGGSGGYVKLYIRYLRAKLERDPKSPKWIVTKRGVGYTFVRSPAPTPEPVSGRGPGRAAAARRHRGSGGAGR